MKFNNRSYVDNGDILFAMIGSIGNPVIVKKEYDFAIKNVALIKFHNIGILNKYIYNYLLILQDKMAFESSSGIQQFVSLRFIRNYVFPLPPLEEQQRIVARIEELFTLVEMLSSAKKVKIAEVKAMPIYNNENLNIPQKRDFDIASLQLAARQEDGVDEETITDVKKQVQEYYAKKIKPFWQIEMTAKNMLNHCGYFDYPYKYIDFMIESCKIDIIPLDIKNDKLLGVFGKDKNNVKFIGFNKNLIPARILFTKAHELGHFILEHELKGELLTDSVFEAKDPQETEASVFAAALLMPKANVIKVIKNSLNKLSIKMESQFEYDNLTVYQKNIIVDDMKDFFHTSKQAIEFRIKNITIEP